MTRRILCLLLPLLCVGCVELDMNLRDRPLRAPATTSAPMATPITPEQVTPENARQQAQGLWDELDRDDSTPAR